MDPIILFLGLDLVALLMLAALAVAVPIALRGWLASGLCGLGLVLCLLALLLGLPAMTLVVPIGPPGLSLNFALDAVSLCFLCIVFLTAAAILAFPATPQAAFRASVCCLAGVAFLLLAADGVGLVLGLAVACGAIWRPEGGARAQAFVLVPLLLLAAVCLLTPAGFAPRFDTVRASPVDPDRATAAAALTVAAIVALLGGRSAPRCPMRAAVVAGVVLPGASYVLLRMLLDLPGAAAANGWGLALLLIGGTIAIIEGWRAAADPEIDSAVACLVRRQIGLGMTGLGLALVARAADLPGAASFALAATMLSAIGGGVASVLTTLAAHALASGAGSLLLFRLGGLVHTMPITSAAMAAGLLGLAAVPPGVGFAAIWLLFQSILSAPRGTGLLMQLPMALSAAAMALSAALATTAAIRLIGVAILGRPRTPRGSSAQESAAPARAVLLALSAVSVLLGILPGPALWLMGDPATEMLTGTPAGVNNPQVAPSYLALPVLAMLALASAGVMLLVRWSRKASKPAGFWADGMPPPAGLPFGEPDAQSAGAGFLPRLPDLSLLRLPPVPALPALRPPGSAVTLWIVLGAFGVLLLALAVSG